ncbi:hypothetical protein KUTeg_022246 [Tegillarca granosa]|uniref:Uncharacterized protein n=1 Tax=Tegillarca granosa TaxID=220873 RepID=A0ABQ9E619_TEGGR|nr:hypothetical protein KUTeg_022246 [Tegillarca granosa]
MDLLTDMSDVHVYIVQDFNIGEVRAASAEIGLTTATTVPTQKKTSVQRRNSGRRHTLANGVDYNMVDKKNETAGRGEEYPIDRIRYCR